MTIQANTLVNDHIPTDGITVENITDTVEYYLSHCGCNPMTAQPWTHDDIVTIICKTSYNWTRTFPAVCKMEIMLLRELVSGMRLDAIQYKLTLKDINDMIQKIRVAGY